MKSVCVQLKKIETVWETLFSSEWANISNIFYMIYMSIGRAYIQNNAHFAISSMPHFTLHAQTSFVLLMSQCIHKYIKYIIYIISV